VIRVAALSLLLGGCAPFFAPAGNPEEPSRLRFLEELLVQEQQELFAEEQQMTARCPSAPVVRRHR